MSQTASVIGRYFGYDELADVHDTSEILDEALADLQQRELIRERSKTNGRAYVFKHAMTQETAYATLLLSARRELHRRVAESLVKNASDRVNDIARHYLEAREEALALPYVVDAGDKAAQSYSTAVAIKYYKRALEILQRNEDAQLARRTYEGLGSALTFAFDLPAATENYNAMYKAGERYGDLPTQVSALNKLGSLSGLMQGDMGEATSLLVNAERLAQQCGDRAGLAEMNMTYCGIHTASGHFDDAVYRLGEATRIGRDLNAEEPMLYGLTHTANTFVQMTRYDDAWEKAQQALQEARELGNSDYQSQLLVGAIPACQMRDGNLEAARQSVETGIELAKQIGAAASESAASRLLGYISWLRGEYDRAIAALQRSIEASQTAGYPYLEADALCVLATTLESVSNKFLEHAGELHVKALEIMELPMGIYNGATNWAEMGFCAMARGNLEMSNMLFRQGLTKPTASKYLARPRLLVGLAYLALGRNDLDEAAKLVEEAHRFVEEKAMKHLTPMVTYADAQISTARGDTKRALEKFTATEQVALTMNMRPMIWQAHAGAAQVLLASGHSSEAEAKRRAARITIDEMADLFTDEMRRTAFIEDAERKLTEDFGLMYVEASGI